MYWTKFLGWDKIYGSLDKTKIKRFKLREGYRLKIENPALLGSVRVPQEQEGVFIILFIVYKCEMCLQIISWKNNQNLSRVFLQIQQTKNIQNLM